MQTDGLRESKGLSWVMNQLRPVGVCMVSTGKLAGRVEIKGTDEKY